MSRFHHRIAFLIAAVLVITCACDAFAQGRRGGQGQNRGAQGPGGRGGFQGGPGGPGGMMFGRGANGSMLLGREDVQKELELVDDQIQQLQSLRDNSDMRDAFTQLRDLPQEERMTKMRELMESAQKKSQDKIDEILLPHQNERLKQLTYQFQMRGGGGLAASDDIAKELGITDEQRDKLREKARQLELQLRKKLQEELIKELTPQQQAKVKDLVGEPFEFQEIPFGQGRGGPGGSGWPGWRAAWPRELSRGV